MSDSLKPEDRAAWIRQLYWREFSWHLTYHYPQIDSAPIRPEFQNFPYEEDEEALARWRSGTTGYPLIDAGMTQLWETGWMHNRLRMITASFLTKDLHVWWPHGARHFLDHLLDGDMASNNHGWQWAAGTGTDAAPYFRVFNPLTQGAKFDPHGDYVRRWVPELAGVDGAGVHDLAVTSRVEGYPSPIVDHAEERREALRRYEAVR